MKGIISSIDDHIDDLVDEEIERCLSVDSPRCFFMFAGAGSGKTTSLIKALNYLDKQYGESFLENGKQVAVITYTNAACDEISRRLQYKPIFFVSTIHSFLWNLIKNYQNDIKEWVINSINSEIVELGQKKTAKKEESIKNKKQRLEKIQTIKKFSYNPNGDNVSYDSLSHNEVIKMGSEFIAKQSTMQDILTAKYPMLLIDESQDTKKELVDALLTVCEKYKDKFIVGMFGDTMQRIYNDGKENLAKCIPNDWANPKKVMNHRSARRIVELANQVRKNIDGQEQQARSDAEEGVVRLFITSDQDDKERVEQDVAKIMAKDTGDSGWNDNTKYKSLILEHHMAASRFGFSKLYDPLSKSERYDTALRDGSIPELSILSNVVLPLVKAYQNGNDFEVAKIVKKNSPLFTKEVSVLESNVQNGKFEDAEKAVEALVKLWDKENLPTCLDVLKSIHNTGLFEIGNHAEELLQDASLDENKEVAALRTALSVPIDVLEKYSAYVTGKTRFATHQGVKGLEFPRVLVIMDDSEARGFLFSYEKLFGAKAESDTDRKNKSEGKDTSIMRTSRLFYVICTRAQKSLAVVAYTKDVNAIRKTALSSNWFFDNEIYIKRTQDSVFECVS